MFFFIIIFIYFLFVFCLLFGALARPARLTSPTSPYWTYLNPEWGGAGSLSLLPRGPSCKRSWSDLYIEIQIHIFRNLLIRFNSLVAFTMYHVATRRSHICSDNRSKDGAHACFFPARLVTIALKFQLPRPYGGNYELTKLANSR